MQIGCLLVLLYITFIYLRECKKHNRKFNETPFNAMLGLGIASVLLDGATAYTVNHLDTVPPVLNMILHALFLISIDSVIFVLFLYMLFITGAYPKGKRDKALIFLPFVINLLIVICNIGSLEYINGTITNYSMGGIGLHLLYYGGDIHYYDHSRIFQTVELY